MPPAPVELAGDVVVLSAPVEADIDRIAEFCRDPEVAAWTTVPTPYDRADAERFVTGIVPDGWGSLDLRLKTSNPEKPLGIDVAQLALDDAKKLRPGQMVTVSCQRMGSGGDVLWVQDCAIEPPGSDYAAKPPAPTPPAPPSAPKTP